MAEQQQSSDSKVKYVDELAAEDDYWLSITDAARATRRQDVTVRTWIAQGKLPVRGRTIGLNQRTRQVRASDLKLLTAIIDNSAVITSDTGKLDLMSIPAQQQQILAEYKHVSAQVDRLLEQLQDTATTLQSTLREQQDASNTVLSELQTTLSTQQARSQDTLVQVHVTLLTAISTQQGAQELLLKTIEDGSLQVTDQQKAYQSTLLTHFTRQSQQTEAALELLRVLQKQIAEQSTVLGYYAQEANSLSQRQTDTLRDMEQQITTTSTQLTRHLDTTKEIIVQHLDTIQETITQQFAILARRQEIQEHEMRQSFASLTQTLAQQLGSLLAPFSQQLTQNSEQQVLLSQRVEAAFSRGEQQIKGQRKMQGKE